VDLAQFDTGTAGPAWAVAGDYHTRSFLRILTNTSSGNAARDLHHVTAYYPTAQLAPTISGGAYRQSVWDATYGAFVSQGTFPTGSTVEVYDAGSWDGTSYVLGSKITSTVAAESVPIPLSRTSPITYNIAGQQVPTRLVQETLSVGPCPTPRASLKNGRPTAAPTGCTCSTTSPPLGGVRAAQPPDRRVRDESVERLRRHELDPSATVQARELSLSSPVCSPDITQSGVTLAPNASAMSRAGAARRGVVA
jgi:hypothetical protein